MSGDIGIRFERNGRAGMITLARPETLNAVTDAMLRAISAHLDEWEADASVERVIIKAVPGRAFSAGGDIRHLYECGIRGEYDFAFFAREYALNARIHAFSKPYIALIDGIAMGGGVGVSFHGSHVVAGEGLAFAMPEVGIGFFPDVGGSYLLSRLPGKLGLYLGLTGQRLKQGDAVRFGLATHSCASGDLEALEDALGETNDIDAVLATFVSNPEPLLSQEELDAIDAVFSEASVEEIVAHLETRDDDWAQSMLTALKQKSPTSLKVALRQIGRGAGLSMPDCMRMEYRILRRILTGPDFYEGIRAAIIDKDNAPIWSPDRLSKVSERDVERYFAHLGEHELQLP